MMSMTLVRRFIVALTIVSPFAAGAQVLLPQQTGAVGLLLGYADPSNLDGRFGFGAEGRLKFNNGLTGSLYFLSSSASENGVDAQIDHYGVGADYSFLASAPGLYAGVRLGMGSAIIEGASTQTDFSVGPAVGYDHPIADAFTVGGEAQLQWTFWDDTETTLYVLGNVKMWF